VKTIAFETFLGIELGRPLGDGDHTHRAARWALGIELSRPLGVEN